MSNLFKCQPAYVFFVTIVFSLILVGIDDYVKGVQFEWSWCISCLLLGLCATFLIAGVCSLSSSLAWIIGMLLTCIACSAICCQLSTMG